MVSALVAEIRSIVEEIFPGAEVAEDPWHGPDRGHDLRFRHRGRWHVVEAKRCSPSGPDIGGTMLFVAAMNQLNKLSVPPDTDLILILLTERVSEFTTQHLPALRHLIQRPPTVVVAGAERCYVLGKDDPEGRWLDRCGSPASDPGDGSSSTAPAGGPLSDAQRLLLRCLLVHPKHAPGWWGGPRGPWRSAGDLAVLGPSPSTISRALSRFTSLHWMKWERSRPLRWLLPGAAIEHLVTQASLGRGSLTPLRHLSGGPIRRYLEKVTRGDLSSSMGNLAVGGWHAVAEHDCKVIMDLTRKPLVLKGSTTAAAIANGLDCIVDPEEPTFFYEKCPPEDLIGVADRSCPVVDLLQAACDVASDPDQGLQQATEIRRLIEAPW